MLFALALSYNPFYAGFLLGDSSPPHLSSVESSAPRVLTLMPTLSFLSLASLIATVLAATHSRSDSYQVPLRIHVLGQPRSYTRPSVSPSATLALFKSTDAHPSPISAPVVLQELRQQERRAQTESDIHLGRHADHPDRRRARTRPKRTRKELCSAV